MVKGNAICNVGAANLLPVVNYILVGDERENIAKLAVLPFQTNLAR